LLASRDYHPWTKGQVERVFRRREEGTVRTYHYEAHRQQRRQVAVYLAAYNFSSHLKALR
jgi:hypothetical protein